MSNLPPPAPGLIYVSGPRREEITDYLDKSEPPIQFTSHALENGFGHPYMFGTRLLVDLIHRPKINSHFTPFKLFKSEDLFVATYAFNDFAFLSGGSGLVYIPKKGNVGQLTVVQYFDPRKTMLEEHESASIGRELAEVTHAVSSAGSGARSGRNFDLESPGNN